MQRPAQARHGQVRSCSGVRLDWVWRFAAVAVQGRFDLFDRLTPMFDQNAIEAMGRDELRYRLLVPGQSLAFDLLLALLELAQLLGSRHNFFLQ